MVLEHGINAELNPRLRVLVISTGPVGMAHSGHIEEFGLRSRRYASAYGLARGWVRPPSIEG
jgi:hypothetical protein